jgi:WD40 repeat protein
MRRSILFLLLIVLSFGLKVSDLKAQQRNDECVVIPDVAMTALDWHPNGELIAVSSNCGVLLLEANLGELVAILPLQDAVNIHSVAFNNDGSLLATSSRFEENGRNATTVWDTGTGEVIYIFPNSFSLMPIAWHPNENIFILSFGDEIRIFDPVQGAVTGSLSAPEIDPAMGVNWARLACWSVQGSYLRVYFDFSSVLLTYPVIEAIQLFGDRGVVQGSSCNRDLTLLASSGGGLRNFTTNEWIPAQEWCEGSSAVWNPDQDREYAVNCDDQTVRIYDREAELTYRLEGDFVGRQRLAFVRSIAYSPDGTRLIALGNDGYARMWDTSTYELLTRVNIADLANSSLEEMEN